MANYFKPAWSAPLRTSAAQFEAIASDFDGKRKSSIDRINALRELDSNYDDTHEGPSITQLVSAMRLIRFGLQSQTFGYRKVSSAAQTTADGLRSLENRTSEFGGLFDLVGKLREAEAENPTSGVDAPETGDDNYGLYRDVVEEFQSVQRQEQELVLTFAQEIRDTPTGRRTNLDNAALEEVSDTLIGNLPEDSEAHQAALAARATLLDEADGTIDSEVGQFEALLEADVSPEDLEAIAAHPRAGEVAAFDPELAVAIATDQVDFPEDDDLDAVADAIANGDSPSEAGLPPLYFPVVYRETWEEIEALREAGADLDPDNPPSDTSASDVRASQRSLENAEEALLADLEESFGIGSNEDINQVRASAATAEYFGDEAWAGERFGGIFEESLDDDGSESDLHPQALVELAEHVGESGETSVAFFGEIGTETTAALPSIVSESIQGNGRVDGVQDGMVIDIIDNFSVGLGEASRSGELPDGFTGDRLIEEGDRNTAALFHAGEFEVGFAADAMEQIMLQPTLQPSGQAKRNPSRWNGYDWDGRDGLIEYYGLDQRDVVFVQGSANPALGIEVSQRLIDGGRADLLIDPAIIRPETDYTDRPPPIAGFLATVGRDPNVGGALLEEASGEETLDAPVAAGVDAIMGHHATVIYDEAYLTEHDIDPEATGRLSQEGALDRFGIGAEEWSSLSGLVGDQGFGAFLFEGNEALKIEALENAIIASEGDPVDFEGSRSFERFGYVSGALQGQWFDNRLEIAQRNQDDVDATNKRIQIGIGVGAAVAIAATGGAAALYFGGSAGTTAAFTAGDIAAGATISAWSPEFWSSDAATVEEIQAEIAAAGTSDTQVTQAQARMAYLAVSGEPLEVDTHGDPSETITVSVETVEVIDPTTGAVSEQSEFVFTDEGNDAWDPITADQRLNWDSVDSDTLAAVESEWVTRVVGAEEQGNRDARGLDGPPLDGGDSDIEEIELVVPYLEGNE